MSYSIEVLEAARVDIDEIYDYIANVLHNPIAAIRRVALIEQAIASLDESPGRFAPVRDDQLALEGYRMIVVKNHLVFFVICEPEKLVSVERVLYGRRNWQRILKDKHDEGETT